MMPDGTRTLVRHPPPGTLLEPGRLSDSATVALAAIVNEGTPRATRRAMAHAIRYWQAWYWLRYRATLPLPDGAVEPPVVLQFLADHVARMGDDGELTNELPAWADKGLVQLGVKRRVGQLSIPTVRQRLSLLGTAHTTLDLPNPVQSGQVRRVMLAVRSSQARDTKERGARPLALNDLERAKAACPDTPAGRRDRALLTVLFDTGGRRRAEIRGLLVEHCDRRPEGYVLAFPRVKVQAGSDKLGRMLRVPLQTPQAHDLDTWLATLSEAGIQDGPVFVPVRGTKQPRYGDRGLSGHAVNAVVQRRLKAAGADAHYTAHSLRKGFATDRLDRGESYAQVQAMTDHSDPRTLVKNYHRPQDILNNPAARASDVDRDNTRRQDDEPNDDPLAR